ncbi:MAG: hypothetical protein CMJ49_10895 [Planctomycetaceae bacterium]|nr:hypothetical protein [Planctomycetaceae bacterium]
MVLAILTVGDLQTSPSAATVNWVSNEGAIMNIKKTQLAWICVLCLATPLPLSAAFVVNGHGAVRSHSNIGVPGESVDFTFAYDLSNFANNNATPNVAGYGAITPIPITATGSVTGLFTGIAPVTRVAVWDDSAGPANDIWQIYVTGTAASLVAIATRNPAHDQFSVPLPDVFADAHDIFVPRHADTSIWTPDANVDFLSSDGTQMLALGHVQWAIIPTPAALPLAAGAVMLGVIRRNRRTRTNPVRRPNG